MNFIVLLLSGKQMLFLKFPQSIPRIFNYISLDRTRSHDPDAKESGKVTTYPSSLYCREAGERSGDRCSVAPMLVLVTEPIPSSHDA